jgi:hypothetical protein
MPVRIWIYPCGHGSCTGAVPSCPECGEPGRFDGWHASSSEAMAAYSHLYGLQPVGPHREVADEVFEGTTRFCPRCGGRQFIGLGGEQWCECPHCEGTGHVFLMPPEDVEELRQAVLAAFPDAGAAR